MSHQDSPTSFEPSPTKTKRRGRDAFRRYRVALRATSSLLGMLPRAVRIALWRLVAGWEGLVGTALRYCIVRATAKACGDNVLIGPYVEVRHFSLLSVGSNVSIHRGCYVDAIGGVTIEDDVSIAHGTSILSFDHQWEDPSMPIRDNPVRLAPVHICRDVWVGCGCRILAGVRIGSRTIVAAGAVVVRDVPPGSIVGGVPAKVLRSIPFPPGRVVE